MALDLDKMHKSASKAERIPEDTYPARVYSVVDLGVQPMTDWKTHEPAPSKPRMMLTFELPTETITVEHNDGTKEELPRLISQEVTLSGHEKSNLMGIMTTLAPDGKSVADLLDKTCMIEVGSTNTGNAKIKNVIKALKGMPIPELSKEAFSFDFDAPDEGKYNLMYNWMKDKIKDAENYTGFADGWGAEEVAEDEVPF